MVSVLLRNKSMARGTITVGGHTLMTLVTKALRIKLALMVARGNIRPVTRITIPRCGK